MDLSNHTPAEGTTDEFSLHDLISILGKEDDVRQVLADLDLPVNGPRHVLADCIATLSDRQDGTAMAVVLIRLASSTSPASLHDEDVQNVSAVYPNLLFTVAHDEVHTEFRAGKSFGLD